MPVKSKPKLSRKALRRLRALWLEMERELILLPRFREFLSMEEARRASILLQNALSKSRRASVHPRTVSDPRGEHG